MPIYKISPFTNPKQDRNDNANIEWICANCIENAIQAFKDYNSRHKHPLRPMDVVKLRFLSPIGFNEHMWVKVLNHVEGIIYKGRLVNEPTAPHENDLKAGSIVTFNRQEIYAHDQSHKRDKKTDRRLLLKKGLYQL